MGSVQTDLLSQRYGATTASAVATHVNPAIALILSHVSIRSFLPNELPEGTLPTLIAAAQSASTGSMLQTWSCIAVTDPERKKHVAALSGGQDFINQAPLFLLWCADLSRIEECADKYGVEAKSLDKMDMFVLSNNDTAMAAQNAGIAAESMGLGFCYTGGSRNNAEELSKYLNLPQKVIGLFGMAIGYPDTENKRGIKPRLPFEEVVHYEKFNGEGRMALDEAYSKTLDNFYQSESKRDHGPWTEFIANFVASDTLDGRENFRAAVDKQGFGMK